MAASSSAVATTRDSSLKSETESLPSLVGRLGDDVMQLFDTKLSLLKVELREEANAYARGGIAIANVAVSKSAAAVIGRREVIEALRPGTA